MNAAERLFLEKGVDSTTINEIVEAAQVAKGTFYHYFSSKNEILRRLADAIPINSLLAWKRQLAPVRKGTGSGGYAPGSTPVS